MNLLLLSVAVFSGHLLFGSVRTLWMNEEKMETVYTALGKSTILRFIETPDRIVVGDQNSYKIEFTGNTVAVKPTGGKETNLFIYTGTKAFGFILRDGRKHLRRFDTYPPQTHDKKSLHPQRSLTSNRRVSHFKKNSNLGFFPSYGDGLALCKKSSKRTETLRYPKGKEDQAAKELR